MIEALIKIFKVKTFFQLVTVFSVFGITGTLSVFITTPILDFFDFKKENFENYALGYFIYYTIKFITIFPLYNLLLIAIATLFLQFEFFWNFQKRMFAKMGFGFFFKKRKDN